MENIRLELKGINKQFTAVKALDDANFVLKKGEVHALLGINGTVSVLEDFIRDVIAAREEND